MRRVAMTLNCAVLNSKGEVVGDNILHFRPVHVVTTVRLLFKNIRVLIRRDLKNCPRDFLKLRPDGAVDPVDYYPMTEALFKHGEKVDLEVSGNNEDLAVTLIKTTWENLNCGRAELFEVLRKVGEEVSDPARETILAEAEKQLVPPSGSKPVAARLSHRLHTVTVQIFPGLASHFDCQVSLSYQTSSGLIVVRQINPGDRSVVYDLLGDSVAKGTVITIDARGEKCEEAKEAFRRIIENLSDIEYWIRSVDLTIFEPERMLQILEIASSDSTTKGVGREEGIDIHKLLSDDAVIVDHGVHSKQQAIGQLAGVLARTSKFSIDRIEAGVWERERFGGTLFPNGLAVPHAILDGVDGVRLAMGIYRSGIDWDDEGQASAAYNRQAYVVLLFLTGGGPRDDYVECLGYVARLFGKVIGIVGELRCAPNSSVALERLRHDEGLLRRMEGRKQGITK